MSYAGVGTGSCWTDLVAQLQLDLKFTLAISYVSWKWIGRWIQSAVGYLIYTEHLYTLQSTAVITIATYNLGLYFLLSWWLMDGSIFLWLGSECTLHSVSCFRLLVYSMHKSCLSVESFLFHHGKMCSSFWVSYVILKIDNYVTFYLQK